MNGSITKWYKFIAISLVISMTSCAKKVWQVTDADTSYYRFDDKLDLSADQSVDDIIKPYKAKLDAEMNEVIGEVAHEMSKRLPESTLGNFVAELLKDQTELIIGDSLDFAMQNHGGLRISSLAKGPISRGKVFELMPFDNMLVVITADGKIIKKLFDVIAYKGGWPMTDDIKLTIKDTIATEILIHGQPIDDDKLYKFAINDYIANGGDNCDFLQEGKVETLNITVRDAIIDYLERTKGTKHSSKITGRVKRSNDNK